MNVHDMMAGIALPDEIVFDGSGGTDKFIRAVRKAAFQAGKHNDDGWCAGFASTCLEGAAFSFYEKLGEDVQSSWKLLRRELVEQFPVTDSSSQSAIQPIPPAAGPTSGRSRSGDLDPPVTPNPSAELDCFIRVVDTSSITLGYISISRHKSGQGLIISRNLSTALCVRPRRAAGSSVFHELCTMAKDGSYQEPLHLIFPDGNGAVGKNSPSSGCLDIRNQNTRWPMSDFWIIYQDGGLDCVWTNPDKSLWLLQLAVSLGDGELRLFPDFKAAGGTSQGFQCVRLVLERDLWGTGWS